MGTLVEVISSLADVNFHTQLTMSAKSSINVSKSMSARSNEGYKN